MQNCGLTEVKCMLGWLACVTVPANQVNMIVHRVSVLQGLPIHSRSAIKQNIKKINNANVLYAKDSQLRFKTGFTHPSGKMWGKWPTPQWHHKASDNTNNAGNGVHGSYCCVGKAAQVLLFISEKIEFIQKFKRQKRTTFSIGSSYSCVIFLNTEWIHSMFLNPLWHNFKEDGTAF